MLVSGGWLKSCVSKFWVAQNCARKFRVTILLRDPLTIPALKINSLKEGFIMTIEWAHEFIPFIPLPSTAKCVLSNAPINCPLPRNARHAASDSARACKK